MKLIEKIATTGTAASITFSNIPQTYTDLIILTSARSDNSVKTELQILPNGLTTNLSSYRLRANGSATSSTTASVISATNDILGVNETANVFNNHEVRIANYSGNRFKTFSIDVVSGEATTTGNVNLVASLWSSTDAISSIQFKPASGSFVTNSTFYLYGITKGTDEIITTS